MWQGPRRHLPWRRATAFYSTGVVHLSRRLPRAQTRVAGIKDLTRCLQLQSAASARFAHEWAPHSTPAAAWGGLAGGGAWGAQSLAGTTSGLDARSRVLAAAL